eukprot:TRINITY_DN1429_c0_g1_i1.p1 TRINITY_DN1429_c0_g1~~TRINITY_DN1429_c0_g1_i1.p1  ORF type:complete len:392 (+),score=101.60 TRINITY_DN1429_c0_g1_i1:72-1178(+)
MVALWRARLLLLVPGTAQAVLSAFDKQGAYTEIVTVPAAANFGPRIPPGGIAGRLRVATPDIFGCNPLDFTLDEAVGQTDMPVVALISRSLQSNMAKDPGSCTFAQKVDNAWRAGAALAVVFDYVDEPLFRMQRATGGPVDSAKIPSVLISASSGRVLHALVSACADPLGPRVFVDASDPYEKMFESLNMTMIGVVCGFLTSLLACASLFLCTSHRLLRRYEAIGGHGRPPRPLSLAQALHMPEKSVTCGCGLEKDSCAICLEAYRVGDKVMHLNCGHVLHAHCLRPWLAERQRTCPLCKADVTDPPPTPSLSRHSSLQGSSARLVPSPAQPVHDTSRAAPQDAAAHHDDSGGAAVEEGLSALLPQRS